MMHFFRISIFLIICFLLSSCQPPKPVVKIGLNTELTGEVPAVGASCLNAAKLFVKQKNNEGGLNIGGVQTPIDLIVGDNGAKADQSVAISQRLISQKGVLAMIGPNISSCAIPAAEIAESRGCLMVSPWSTTPRTTINTTTGHFKKYVFRACFTENFEIPMLVYFAINKLHKHKAAILYDMSSESPNSVAKLFKKTFIKEGGAVVDEETYTTGDRDFSAQLTKIKAASPDVIFLPAYYIDVPLIAEQARRLGITATFLGFNAWSTPEMTKLDYHHYLEGSYFSNHFSFQSNAPKAKQFVAGYEAEYHAPPDDIAALTYDTMALVAEAIVKAGKLNREDICNKMADIQELSGATGNFKYRNGSHDPSKSVEILSIKDGAFVYTTTVEP